MDVYYIPTFCVQGNVWFRNTTTPNITERAVDDIRRLYNVEHIDHTFIATWDHIRYNKDNNMKVNLNLHIPNLLR